MKINFFQKKETPREEIFFQKSSNYSNHLGNVLEVVTDRKLAIDWRTYDPITGAEIFDIDGESMPDGIIEYYTADVVSQSDYFPFGMLMPNRNEGGNEYRYGMNGMEKDDEVKGSGNSYTTMFRQYDPRIGRWLSPDPITHHQFSPYSAFDNNPIVIADPSGADGEDPKDYKEVQGIGGESYQIPKEKNANVKFYEVAKTPLGITGTATATEYVADTPIGSVKSFYGDDGAIYSPHWGTLDGLLYFKGYSNAKGEPYVNPTMDDRVYLKEGQIPIVGENIAIHDGVGMGEIRLSSEPTSTLYQDASFVFRFDTKDMFGTNVLPNSSGDPTADKWTGFLYMSNVDENPAEIFNNAIVSLSYTGVSIGYQGLGFSGGLMVIVGKDDVGKKVFELSGVMAGAGAGTNPLPVDSSYDGDAPFETRTHYKPNKVDSTRQGL